jgi:hypothetical protein
VYVCVRVCACDVCVMCVCVCRVCVCVCRVCVSGMGEVVW